MSIPFQENNTTLPDLSLLTKWYEQYAPSLYGLLLKISEEQSPVASSLLVKVFEAMASGQPAPQDRQGTCFPWMVRIMIRIVRENGFPITADFYKSADTPAPDGIDELATA